MKKSILPEQRRGILRRLLQEKPFLRVIETVNGLEGLIAERAFAWDADGTQKTFDALWLSGFSHAAFKGKPDTGIVGIEEKLAAVQEIFDVTQKPLLVDCDTGGSIPHLCRYVAALERAGVSAAVIEDKAGEKRNSLYGVPGLHQMEDAEMFAQKLRAAKAALSTNDFMLFARIESLIAGESYEEALRRAEQYCQAGADGIVIHSIAEDGADAFSFAAAFKARFKTIPLVMIPTAYHSFTDHTLHSKGADVIIYANHLMRSAYLAMEQTAAAILRDGNTVCVDARYCADVRTILNLIDGE